jgi:hypothetical protein
MKAKKVNAWFPRRLGTMEKKNWKTFIQSEKFGRAALELEGRPTVLAVRKKLRFSQGLVFFR